MHILTGKPDFLGEGGRPQSAAFARALQGYRLSMAGLYTRGARKLEESLAALEQMPGEDSDRAHALLLSGLAARCQGQWAQVESRLAEAHPKLSARAEPDLAAMCLALRVEALCATHGLEEARAAVPKESAMGELALATLHLARGNLTEAIELARIAWERAGLPELQAWAVLLRAEAQLDQGNPLEARSELESLAVQLERRGPLGEAYVRTLCLLARAATEALWMPGATARSSEEARALVHRAAGYATNMPRYSAGAHALRAQLLLVERDPGADAVLEDALAQLEACGVRLDQGRALARHAACMAGLAPSSVRLTQAADLLERLGADTRCDTLRRLEGRSSLLGPATPLLNRSLFTSQVGEPSEGIELRAVFDVNRAISSTVSLDHLLQQILQEVAKVLHAERGALLRLTAEGGLHCAAAHGLDPERVREGTDEISFGVVREVQRSGKTVLTDDAQLDERFRGHASVLATDLRSILCAPLRTPKALLGFLYLDSTLRARIFRDSHRELLEVFATQAAVALENALAFAEIEQLTRNLEKKVEERTRELTQANQTLSATLENLRNTQLRLLEAEKQALEKEMALARSIQESIVPVPELISRPGLLMRGLLSPASRVGGDFWSYFSLPGDRTLLLIGDVTGHGVGAGMLTAVAKACGDTLLRRGWDQDVASFLCTLSDVVYDSARGAMTMTAFACIVDPRTRTLDFANAGHNLPYVIEAAEGLPRLRSLLARGQPLGDAVGTRFHLLTRPYSPGDRLVLFTDGLIECTNAIGRQLGERRLAQLILDHAREPLERQLDSVMQGADAFFGDHPRRDDLTLVMAGLL